MSEKKAKVFWFRVGRFFCRIFCKLFFRLRVYGKENIPADGAFLLVSNHQSFLDPVFCGVPLKRDLFFLARHTLFSNKFFGKVLWAINAMPVKRGQADMSAMKMVIARLKAGFGVCLFPEATRSSDGKIAAFKPGLGLLCKRGDAPIVPMVVDGAFEAWPRHKKIFSPWRRISICYGDRISLEQIKNMDDRELAENLTNTLRRMQNECRLKEGKDHYRYE